MSPRDSEISWTVWVLDRSPKSSMRGMPVLKLDRSETNSGPPPTSTNFAVLGIDFRAARSNTNFGFLY